MQTSHFAPRQFLPETIDLTDTAQLVPVFHKLDAELNEAASLADLEARLLHHSEVSAALSESSSLTYIAMTCPTDDEAIMDYNNLDYNNLDYNNRQHRFGSV